MAESICGENCGQCALKSQCAGCTATKGRPFGKACVVAACCRSAGYEKCGQCPSCALRERLIDAFNALGISDMEKVTSLNALKGSYVNLPYALPNGQTVRLWDDDRIYLGNLVRKANSARQYGLAADEKYLMVCETDGDRSHAEIVVFKRSN